MVGFARRAFQVAERNMQNLESIQIMRLITFRNTQRDLVLHALHVFRRALEEAVAVHRVVHDIEVLERVELLQSPVADFLQIIVEEVEPRELVHVERRERVVGNAGDVVLAQTQFFEIRESGKRELRQSSDRVSVQLQDFEHFELFEHINAEFQLVVDQDQFFERIARETLRKVAQAIVRQIERCHETWEREIDGTPVVANAADAAGARVAGTAPRALDVASRHCALFVAGAFEIRLVQILQQRSRLVARTGAFRAKSSRF